MPKDLDDEIDDAELFSTDDIKIEFQQTKGMCKVYMIMKSDTPINLFRYYLALRRYITSIECELGVMDETDSYEQH